MFHHVVLMEFTAAADRHFFEQVEAFAERVRRDAPNLLRYVFSRNIASRSDGLTHGIVSSFVSAADHDAYQASYMTPFIARIIVCEIDEEQP